MNCRTCRAPITADMAFCINCGTRLEPTSSAGAPTTRVPTAPETAPFEAERNYTERPPHTPYTPQPYSPQPYSPRQYQQGPLYTQPTLPTSNTAVVSLILGILAWVALPLIGAIGAIIAGHIARREINDSNGQLGGNGLATAGLILGYIQLIPGIFGCIILFFFITLAAV